jgi:CheY-like chemotaxis protein
MDTCTTLPTSQVPADPGRDRGERQRSILVVDDEKDLQRLVARVLDDAGFLVALAGDGSEALAKIRAQPPDLIVLDLMMPVMDGWEVLERLRDVPHAPPVVVLSACPDDRRAARAGAVACMRKRSASERSLPRAAKWPPVETR